MDCVVLAGGRPRVGDPLYECTAGLPKAMLPIAGRPVLEYVVDALQQAKSIDQIAIVGPEETQEFDLKGSVHFIPDQGSLVKNALEGMAWFRERQEERNHILICSSDIPAITGPIVEDLIAACSPLQYAVYYFFVTKEVMEGRFPGAKRTYARLGASRLAGGDMIVTNLEAVNKARLILESIEDSRKYPWKIARIVGLAMLLKYLTGRLSTEDIELKASELLQRRVKITVTPAAEIAMDIDKPEHLALLQFDILARDKISGHSDSVLY